MPVVICMARLEYVKGIDVLLQAWKRVQDRLPTPAHLLLVGDGSLRPQLERLTRALALTAYVEFAGLRTDTVAQWQRGSLCVLPSRREGMPAALLEAMACALPCVATRVSGSEDLIQSGYNGLLVEPDDDGSLADALLQLLLDAELRTRYGWAARAMVEQHYTLEHMLHRYLELYDALVQPLGLVLSGTASAK
jgi:glycosyltransferase involved in cell wall biosynthesis